MSNLRNSPAFEQLSKQIENSLDDKLKKEFYGGATLLEPAPESTLTLDALIKMANDLPKLPDHRIFVCNDMAWPYEYLVLKKEDGQHIIMNRTGRMKLKRELGEQCNFNEAVNKQSTLFLSGIRIDEINLDEAVEMVVSHLKGIDDD